MVYFLNILIPVVVLAVLGFVAGGACVFGGKCVREGDEVQLELNTEEEKTELRAFVHCSGHDAERKFTYVGERDCYSANLLSGGDKACAFSCLGLGSCAEVCPHGAISIINGVAEADAEKCDGCGKCIVACPRGVISLVPRTAIYNVRCANRALGSQTRKLCEVGCIGCHACEKACKYGAIEINESLARIDYSKCTSCGECAAACPRGIITAPAPEAVEEEFDESEYFSLSVDADEAEEEATVSE
ncbi:MAG: 4Fe-4S binding protein [Oscillospiraceae bacterium]|nr:4Fe-4S binding protein [Oscillospiraceae bacterium]